MEQREIRTVGHSTHSADRFVDLLRSAGVEAGIAYEPFGDEHGRRRGDDAFGAYAEYMRTDGFPDALG